MADDVREAGLRLVLEDLDGYVRGADRANEATAGVAKAVGDAAGKAREGTKEIGKFGSEADKQSGLVGKLTGSIGKLAGAATGLGAAFAGAFAVKEAFQLGDKISKEVRNLSAQTGLASEEASKLRFAFEESDVGASTGAAAITKFSRGLKGLTDIEDGVIVSGAGVSKALYDMGIRTEDVAGKQLPFSDILGQVADRFKDMPDGIQKTALATQLFGRSGRQLLLLLNKGSEGIKELGLDAEKLGFVLSKDQVDALRANVLAQKKFHTALEGVGLQLSLALTPALAIVLQGALQLARGFNQKVVPGIKEFGKILSAVLKSVLPEFLPQLILFGRVFTNVFFYEARLAIIRLIPPLVAFGRLIRTVLREFFYILRTGDRDLGAFPKRLRVIIAIVDIFALVLRETAHNLFTMFNAIRAYATGLRFMLNGVDEFRIGLSFLPEPLAKILDFLQRLSKPIGDLIDRFRKATGVTTPLYTIIQRLGDKAIPLLADALTGFLAVLAVAKVLDFAAAIGSLATEVLTFPFDVLAKGVGVVTDFVSGVAGLVGKAVSFAFNVIGTGLDIISTVAGWVAKGVIGAAELTINAAGNALDFIRGLLTGEVQRLVSVNQIKVPFTFTPDDQLSQDAKARLEKQGEQGGTAFAGGFFNSIGQTAGTVFTLISGFIVGTLATFVGNRASNKAAGQLAKGFTKGFGEFLGKLLPETLTETLGGILARGTIGLRGAGVGTAVVQILISAIEIAIDAFQKDFEQLGIRTGFIIGGAILGGVIAGLGTFGVGIPAGAIIGAGVGGFIADVIIATMQDAFVNFFTKTLPPLIKQLPSILGQALGRALAIAIALPFIALGLELKFIFKQLPRFIAEAAPAVVRAIVDLNQLIAGALADGLAAAARAAVPKFALALRLGLQLAIRLIDPRVIGRDLIEQLLLTIRDPARIARGLEALGRALAKGLGKAGDLAAQAFADGLVVLDKSVRAIFKGLEFALGDFVRGFVAGFVHQWEEINRITSGGLNEAVTTITSIPAKVALGAIAIGLAIKNGIVDGLEAVAKFLSDFPSRVALQAIAIGRAIGNGLRAGLEGIGNLGGTVADAITGAVTSALSRVARLAADFFAAVKKGLDALPIPGGNPAGNTLQAVIDTLRAISGAEIALRPAPVNNPIQQLPGPLGPNPVPGFAEGIERVPRNMLAFLHEGERVLSSQQNRLLSGILGSLSGVGAQAGPSAAPGPSGGLSSILGLLQNLPAGRLAGNTYSIAFAPTLNTEAGLDDGQLRLKLHDMVDEMFAGSASRAQRLGTSLGAGIG